VIICSKEEGCAGTENARSVNRETAGREAR